MKKKNNKKKNHHPKKVDPKQYQNITPEDIATVYPSGHKLKQRYVITEMISKGGFGRIYKAKDLNANKIVAIKQLITRGDTYENSAFEREFYILASITHPAFPKMIDYINETTAQCIVMDYIDGKDLHTLLQQRGSPFDTDLVLTWADLMLEALEYIHSKTPPIIHRDITPRNIMLTESNQLLLMDFGLAQGRVAGMTHLTSGRKPLSYTACYTTLERIIEGITNERTDLYGLAATLFYLLTYEQPRDAQVRLQGFLFNNSDPQRLANELNPEVSYDIAKILMNAMSLNNSEQYKSAKEMRSALSNVAKTYRLRRKPSFEPFEISIPLPDGGELVSEVNITRDRNGFLWTKWRTKLPENTQVHVDISHLRMNPDTGEASFPQSGGADKSHIQIKQGYLTHSTAITNGGGPFNQGKFKLSFYINTNAFWKQPVSLDGLFWISKDSTPALSRNNTDEPNELLDIMEKLQGRTIDRKKALAGWEFRLQIHIDLPPLNLEAPSGGLTIKDFQDLINDSLIKSKEITESLGHIVQNLNRLQGDMISLTGEVNSVKELQLNNPKSYQQRLTSIFDKTATVLKQFADDSLPKVKVFSNLYPVVIGVYDLIATLLFSLKELPDILKPIVKILALAIKQFPDINYVKSQILLLRAAIDQLPSLSISIMNEKMQVSGMLNTLITHLESAAAQTNTVIEKFDDILTRFDLMD